MTQNGIEQGMTDAGSSFRLRFGKGFLRILPSFLLMNFAAFAQFTTYLGSPGAFPSLTGVTQTIQARASHPVAATSVGGLYIVIGSASSVASGGNGELRINFANNSGVMSLNMLDNRGSGAIAPLNNLVVGTNAVSPPIGFPDLKLTQYRLAFAGKELQLDLTLTRSASYSGLKQIVVAGVAAAPYQYTSPWWVSDGQWNVVSGPIITNFTGITTTPVNYTPVAAIGQNSPSPCLLTPTPSDSPETIPVNAIPIGPYCATATVTGFAGPMALGQVTATVGGRNAPVLSVDTTGTQVSIAGAGVASWDGTTQSVVITSAGVSTSPYSITVGTPGANPVANAGACNTTAIPLCWAAASRFLEQAAFGPTHKDVVHLQKIGIDAWLTEQFGKPQVTPFDSTATNVEGRFFYNAVFAPDQLRKKTAFALSQLFVVSAIKDAETPLAVSPYFNTLDQYSLTNYPTLLRAITLSPQMGYYLDMSGNTKTNPSENYAREILQLFSIGTVMLNGGGQPVDANGTVVTATNGLVAKPTYGHAEIANFARVFTGWVIDYNYPTYYWNAPSMILSADQTTHDTGAKTLLTVPGLTLANSSVAAGGTATSDLTAALANIESHPNVAPFVSKFLIQHLVTSNPTSAYVQRVAAQFSSTNGDMPTVLRAILKDSEARAGDTAPDGNPSFGHLQEPAEWLSSLCRVTKIPLIDNTNGLGGAAPWGFSASLGQHIFYPPSVFNYYLPSNPVSQKFLAGTSLLGPEFQIQSPSAAYQRLFVDIGDLTGTPWGQVDMVANYLANIDLGPWSNLAAVAGDYDLLIDALDASMTHGTMPTALHNAIKSALPPPGATNPLFNYYTNPYATAKLAIYLLSTHSYYQVNH